MSRPRLLDLFCGAGGCAVGYHRAGFDVVGIDKQPMPRYPFPFAQGDALKMLRWMIAGHGFGIDGPPPLYMNRFYGLADFDVIHASPPCQTYSRCKRIGNGRPGHEDLVSETRRLLEMSGKPYVIENVEGAPLRHPLKLCGTYFGLKTRRHRLFESSLLLMSAGECRHAEGDIIVFGHSVEKIGTRAAAYQDASGRTHYRRERLAKKDGAKVMGIDWMNRAELSQAIPPAYCEFIGKQLIRAIESSQDTGPKETDQ